jgi:LysR family transcriptional regulator, transcriptional activator for dmlA
MIDRIDLALVLAVKETGSLTGAAKRLQITGAAVTKRLAQIEAWLAVKLFVRTTRSVTATPEGEMFCEHARQLVAGFDTLESRLTEFTTTPVGSIKLASNVGFGRQWLAPAIHAFSQTFASVQIELHLLNRLPDLQAEGFDAAIWLWQPVSTQWIVHTLARNTRVVVASVDYLQRHGTPAAPEDLRDHQCLLMREREMPANTWRLSRLVPHEGDAPMIEVKVSGVLSSNNGEVLRDWALSGAGIALRPYWDVHEHIQSGRLVRVLGDYAKLDADVQWIAPYRAHLPERVRLLREFLAARIRGAAWVG